MTWVADIDRYRKFARSATSGVVLTTKDHWFWKFAWFVLVIFTFGIYSIKMPLSRFLNDFATTIGPIQGYPRHWFVLSKRLLTHEARHAQQAQWFGYAVPVLGWLPGHIGGFVRALVGLPLFGLLYLILFFPLGFAFFRWRFEIDADLAAYRWMVKHGFSDKKILERASKFGEKVCGGSYGWAWPKWLGGIRGFRRAAEKAILEGRT